MSRIVRRRPARTARALSRRPARLETQVRALAPRVPPAPYTPVFLQVMHVRTATGCSMPAARDAVIATRGDLEAACERIRRTGLA